MSLVCCVPGTFHACPPPPPPTQVTIAEAALTLLQFVLLLVIGWAVDVRVWRRLSPRRRQQEGSGTGSLESPAPGTADAVVVSELLGAWQAGRGCCRCQQQPFWQPL